MTAVDPGSELGAELGRLRSLDGAKWSRYDDDVLPAWVADMDIAPAPMAVEAIRAVLDRGDVGYNLAAVNAIPEAFARWHEEGHGWRPDPDRLWLFNDVLHAIEFTIWHHTEPGDGIVVFTPIYPPFLAAIENSGRRIVPCPLDRDGWRLDADRLRSVIDDRTAIILWCHPHNPTGRVFDETELEALGEIAADHDLLVVSDEVWADLVHPGGPRHRSVATIDGLADQSVVVSSASKAFNLAGLRSAVLHAGSDRVHGTLGRQPTHLRGAVNTLGAEATLACWQRGRPWLEDVRRHLVGQRDHLARRLAEEAPAIGFTVPEATYLAWLDLRAHGLGDRPTKHLLDEGRIALSPGHEYGPLGLGHARLNFATSRSILDELIDRMLGALPPA